MSLPHHFVLVTGVTGFVAAHVLRAFLSGGHKVRGTVRTAEQGAAITKKYSEFHDRFEVVVVPDLTTPSALDEALKGVDALVHVASPFAYHFKDPKTEVVDVAINATNNALKSAALSPSVTRVVVTSSFAAVLNSALGTNHTYTDDDWNPVTLEYALEANNPVIYYVASKKLAEKAVYDFVEQNKPHFDVVTLNPPMIFGPLEHDATIETLNESTKQLWDIVSAKSDTVPETRVPVFVDVRDVAAAHVRAVENPKASGRYLLSTGNYSWQAIIDIAHKAFPERKIIPVGKPGENHPAYKTDHSKAHKELGLDFTPLEVTVKDTLTQLFHLADKK